MPKAYWIARATVSDPDQYKLYAEAASAVFPKYGAKVLARGGRHAILEGAGRPRNVVIEFNSYDDAVACYNSADYQAARVKRKGAGEVEIVIVEGV
ncbi:DUF1330 domain-containing protein [soil metagenome]